ncbi:MAG TPA: ABC transporter permease [Spirochaetaceae bacterium]|jgi:simple sugar transport system permease protein|nr:ABC transporter permease [Spirochaetaceae bacterium]HCX96819.1 ABC transporter permease [Spirochaetaceae bacterium]
MFRKILRQNEAYVFLLILALSIVIGMRNPSFFSFENITGFLKSYSMIGIMSVGTLFVLILGGTDVSFTAIAQVVEYAVVVLIMKFGGNIFVAFFEAAILGIVLGLINGLVIHKFRVPIIIVTIATFNIYFGMLYVITKGKLINNIPQMFKDFGNILLFPQKSAIGGTYGLSLMPLIWLAALILGWIILRKTMIGRGIFAVGGNEIAAERIGINTFATKLFVFGFVGFLAGIAGVVHVAIVQSVVPNIIVGKELEVIAAVVIGGASIFGGRGTIFGTFLGVLLFAMLNNGLTLLRISSYWYSVTIGAIILIAITVSAYQRLQRAKTNVKVQIQE